MSSRNREKRSRTPSVETNTSFVKNVTSRVSGLLPTTLTKWFGSPSTSSANGSAPTAAADPTDSSTDDEALDPPPSKRVRFSASGSSFFATQDANNVPTDTLEPGTPYSVVQSPPSRTAFRRDTNYASTPVSALDPPAPVDRVEDTTMFKHHTVASVGPSVAAKRKSLFDSEMNSDASIRACAKTSCNTMRDPNEPSFKASLLASPFYPGRTMYGGASAAYMNQANIKQRKKAIVYQSNTTDNTISYSARRVMDLLEQYSSPLNDAKRISQYLASPSPRSSMNSLNSSGQSNKLASYKTQELHVPSIASILRVKRRGRLMDTTAAARQIIASRSSTSDYHEFIPTRCKPAEPVQPGSESQSNLTSKVKSRLTRPTRRKGQDIEAEMPAPVSLPSAVLHIGRDNLPNFLEPPPAPPATNTPSSVYTFTETSTKVTETKKVSKIFETPILKPDAVPTINPYKFASPVRISSDLVNHDSTLPKFTFGSPERKIEAKSRDSNTDSSVVGPQESAVNDDKDWKCAVCWVPNKAVADKCVCCGGAPQPASKPKKCSVCKLADSQATGDQCVNCAKMTTNNITNPLVSKDEPSKWKCEVCLVPNETDAEKCVCCSASNPKQSAKSAPTSDAGSDWKCDVCWVPNKGSVDKCAACGGAKPGAKPSAKAVNQNANTTFNFGIKPSSSCSDFNMKPSQPDNMLYNIVKSQVSKWECPSCLVRNDGDKTKCACCEADKPGSVKEPEKKFNFGVNTSFKFGIDPKLQEPPKPVETKPAEEPKQDAVPAENKKEESETNNNVLPKTPAFSFGLPRGQKKPEDQTDGAKKAEAKVDSAQLNFSFGAPATAAAAPAAKPPEAKATEKPQEVPTVTFALPKPKEAPKTAPSFTFGATQPAEPAEKAEVPTVPVLAAKEVRDAPVSTSATLPTPAQPAAAATSAGAASTFTFGSLKPAANLFAPVATTSSAPVTFGAALPAPVTVTAALFQAPATTSSAPLSIFQKPEPATATPSLFQKTEPVVTTAAAAPFSFGSNAPPAAAEKPKFNFTFGSNKTESTPIFGAPTDPSTNNKFTLPTGNALGSGTGLSSTSGGNGLTGNALGGTGLAGNTLGGGTLGTGTGLGATPMSNALGGNGMSSPIAGGVLGSNSLPANPLGSSTPSSNLQTSSVGGGIFGAAMPKENNIWSSSNNLFASNTTANTNSLQKPAAFTFGGATSSPAFGGAQTVPNVFGMGSQPSNQASVFSPPAAGSAGGWGSAAAATAPAPVVFGATQASAPTFDSPTPAPAFNFSAQQQPNRVFGFGQQPQQQQPTPGVYNFGSSPAAPQVQFNMGSAPNTAVRRMRKAVRKNTPR